MKLFPFRLFWVLRIRDPCSNHRQRRIHWELSFPKICKAFHQEYFIQSNSDSWLSLFGPLCELCLMLESWGLESSVIQQILLCLRLSMWYPHLRRWYSARRLRFKGPFGSFRHFTVFWTDLPIRRFSWNWSFSFWVRFRFSPWLFGDGQRRGSWCCFIKFQWCSLWRHRSWPYRSFCKPPWSLLSYRHFIDPLFVRFTLFCT